jgi:hypothetical protein
MDIHSIAASYQPSRREREAKGEATSHPKAGQSHRAGGHAATTVAATTVVTQRQRSANTVVTPPLAAGPEATLAAARALLHNPLGLGKST